MHHVKIIKTKIIDNLSHGKPALADLAASDTTNTSNVASALTSLRKSGKILRHPSGDYSLAGHLSERPK